jgi:hypothetical protein
MLVDRWINDVILEAGSSHQLDSFRHSDGIGAWLQPGERHLLSDAQDQRVTGGR